MSATTAPAVIVSDDKIGGRVAEKLASRNGLQLYVYRSTNWTRIGRVLLGAQLRPGVLWADVYRGAKPRGRAREFSRRFAATPISWRSSPAASVRCFCSVRASS